MMNDKLSEKLKSQAIDFGLCKEWTNEWGNPDKEELCQKYIKGIDFCLLNRYPSNEIIKKEFADVRKKFNIFVDDNDEYITNPKWAIFNGNCNSVITYKDYGIGDIYIKDNSSIGLVALDNSIVHITLLDDAKLKVISTKYTRLFVYTNSPQNVFKENVEGKLIIRPYKVQ